MKTKNNYLLLTLLFLSMNSYALNISGVEKPVTDSLYDNRSCNDLYMQASALEQDTYFNKISIYNDNKSRSAGIAMTVFAPAIYYLGYSAFQNYNNQLRSEAAFSEIEELRFRMAEKRCFVAK